MCWSNFQDCCKCLAYSILFVCVLQASRCMFATGNTTGSCLSLLRLNKTWRMKWRVSYTPSQKLWVSFQTYRLFTFVYFITYSLLHLWASFLLPLDLNDPEWSHHVNPSPPFVVCLFSFHSCISVQTSTSFSVSSCRASMLFCNLLQTKWSNFLI